jgi:hypothetical protein
LKIFNTQVYGLSESLKASAYPFSLNIKDNGEEGFYISPAATEKDLNRGSKLGNTLHGSGHDCFLKGITVQYDLQAPEFFWRQFDRYHFHDYVSSQSKMHCILKFDIAKMCNQYVDKRVINVVNEYIDAYNDYDDYVDACIKFNTPKDLIDTKEVLFQKIMSNCPMGFELTARIASNYLQEKSIYYQRKSHKLEQWHYYCDWIKSLPMFEELCLKGE